MCSLPFRCIFVLAFVIANENLTIILFYFILFYFILFYFILFYFILFYLASPQGQGHHNSVSRLLWARVT